MYFTVVFFGVIMLFPLLNAAPTTSTTTDSPDYDTSSDPDAATDASPTAQPDQPDGDEEFIPDDVNKAPAPDASYIVIRSGHKLTSNVKIPSRDGHLYLEFDDFGNLVVQKACDDKVLWKRYSPANETGHGEDFLNQELVMERDGDLVFFGGTGQLYAETWTEDNRGADLRLDEFGYLCVFMFNRCIWSNQKRFSTLVCPGEPPRTIAPIPDISATSSADTGSK